MIFKRLPASISRALDFLESRSYYTFCSDPAGDAAYSFDCHGDGVAVCEEQLAVVLHRIFSETCKPFPEDRQRGARFKSGCRRLASGLVCSTVIFHNLGLWGTVTY